MAGRNELHILVVLSVSLLLIGRECRVLAPNMSAGYHISTNSLNKYWVYKIKLNNKKKIKKYKAYLVIKSF